MLVILTSTSISAQCPTPPSQSGTSCVTATFLCANELHEYQGTLINSINTNGPSPLCPSGGEANNIQWYRFIVCDEYVELLITPSNCTTVDDNGQPVSGMQAGIYRECDYTQSLACSEDGQTNAFTLSGNNFTPGQQVFMFVDGKAGSVCGYQFEIIAGIDTTSYYSESDSLDVAEDGMVEGEGSSCLGQANYGYSSPTCVGNITRVGCVDNEPKELCHEWIITMMVDSIPTVVDTCYNFIGDSTAAEILVDWLCVGNYTINVNIHSIPNIPFCGTQNLECGELLPLSVSVIGITENILPTIFLCEGESYTFCGETYTEDIIAYCEIDTCVFDVQPIEFKPPMFNYMGTQFVCAGSDCFFYNGVEYCDPGFYSVPNQNSQCEEYDEFEIVDLFDVALNTTASNDIDCIEDSSQLSAFIDLQGYYGNVDIAWTDGLGNQVGNSFDLNVTVGGTYTCIISFPEYDFMCTKESTVYISENTDDVIANLHYQDINCGNPETVVQYNANQNIINHRWEGPNGFYSTDSNPSITEGGMYQVILTAENGCEFEDGFEIEENIELPIADFVPHEYWGCSTESMTIQLDLSNSDWLVTWQTANGEIIEQEQNQIQISSPGDYQATILDPITQCEYIVATTIENDPEMLVDFKIQTGDIYCYGADDGVLSIEDIIGGVAPFTITINGESVETLYQKELPPGTYEVILTDANGCEIIQSIEITELPDIVLEIDSEIQVIYQSDEMIYLSIIAPSDVETILWTDQSDNILGEGSELMVNITEDMEISVTVTDIYGCEKNKNIMVKVRLADDVYIPNIFSPNNDGFNDFFTAYSVKSPGKVETLTVYDRWGNLVFTADESDLNDEEKGWDGMFNGKPLQPGAYVYQATINNGGGIKESRHGSVTLVR